MVLLISEGKNRVVGQAQGSLLCVPFNPTDLSQIWKHNLSAHLYCREGGFCQDLWDLPSFFFSCCCGFHGHNLKKINANISEIKQHKSLVD